MVPECSKTWVLEMNMHAACMAISTLLTEPACGDLFGTFIFLAPIPLLPLQTFGPALLLLFRSFASLPLFLFLSHFLSSSQSDWQSRCV